VAEALILEFDGFTKETYLAVNENLGIDPRDGSGDWPDGLTSHTATIKDGGLVVFEIWESREQHEAFLRDRLGPALQQAGVQGPPSRDEWMEIAAAHSTR
jgi:hypothetical protein